MTTATRHKASLENCGERLAGLKAECPCNVEFNHEVGECDMPNLPNRQDPCPHYDESDKPPDEWEYCGGTGEALRFPQLSKFKYYQYFRHDVYVERGLNKKERIPFVRLEDVLFDLWLTLHHSEFKEVGDLIWTAFNKMGACLEGVTVALCTATEGEHED